MAGNYYSNLTLEQKNRNNFYIFVLFLSFVWAGFYESSTSIVDSFLFGYNNLFDFGSTTFIYSFFFILMSAVVRLLGFEIIFWFYKLILSYRVYSFVVPADKFKIECRVYFSIRNIIYGIFANLCFLYPYIYNYLKFIDIISIIIVITIFSYHIQKTYSEPIISHFVFKNFCVPVLTYEVIMGLLYFWRCL